MILLSLSPLKSTLICFIPLSFHSTHNSSVQITKTSILLNPMVNSQSLSLSVAFDAHDYFYEILFPCTKLNSWYFKHAPSLVSDNSIFPIAWTQNFGVIFNFFLFLKLSSNKLANPNGSAIKIYPEIWPFLPLTEDIIIYYLGYYESNSSPFFYPVLVCDPSPYNTLGYFQEVKTYNLFVQIFQSLSMSPRGKANPFMMTYKALYNLTPVTFLILTTIIVLICPHLWCWTWCILCLNLCVVYPLISFIIESVHILPFNKAFLHLLIKNINPSSLHSQPSFILYFLLYLLHYDKICILW